MRIPCLLLSTIFGVCFTGPARAQATGSGGAAPKVRDYTWHVRAGVGVNPVVSRYPELPKAHTGYGTSLTGLLQLPYRISAGVGFDWERYTFDSKNTGDPNDAPPRYKNEQLIHTRLMALGQWDILERRLVTPFVLVGVGYGWEGSKITTWQCSPRLASGAVLGIGGGIDVALHRAVALGLEYRVNTLPLGGRECTMALIPNEPEGAPSDFFSQRIGLTLTLHG